MTARASLADLERSVALDGRSNGFRVTMSGVPLTFRSEDAASVAVWTPVTATVIRRYPRRLLRRLPDSYPKAKDRFRAMCARSRTSNLEAQSCPLAEGSRLDEKLGLPDQLKNRAKTAGSCISTAGQTRVAAFRDGARSGFHYGHADAAGRRRSVASCRPFPSVRSGRDRRGRPLPPDRG